jgi:hypothetical protein
LLTTCCTRSLSTLSTPPKHNENKTPEKDENYTKSDKDKLYSMDQQSIPDSSTTAEILWDKRRSKTNASPQQREHSSIQINEKTIERHSM